MPGDERYAIRVFERSVRHIAPTKYRSDQVRVWLGVDRDERKWARRMSGRETLVAMCGATIVGWVELERDGHLDMLYCAPEVTQCGVADALYDALILRAKQLSLARIFAETSLFAEAFFRRKGWAVEAHETLVHDGVTIERALMSIVL